MMSQDATVGAGLGATTKGSLGGRSKAQAVLPAVELSCCMPVPGLGELTARLLSGLGYLLGRGAPAPATGSGDEPAGVVHARVGSPKASPPQSPFFAFRALSPSPKAGAGVPSRRSPPPPVPPPYHASIASAGGIMPSLHSKAAVGAGAEDETAGATTATTLRSSTAKAASPAPPPLPAPLSPEAGKVRAVAPSVQLKRVEGLGLDTGAGGPEGTAGGLLRSTSLTSAAGAPSSPSSARIPQVPSPARGAGPSTPPSESKDLVLGSVPGGQEGTTVDTKSNIGVSGVALDFSAVGGGADVGGGVAVTTSAEGVGAATGAVVVGTPKMANALLQDIAAKKSERAPGPVNSSSPRTGGGTPAAADEPGDRPASVGKGVEAPPRPRALLDAIQKRAPLKDAAARQLREEPVAEGSWAHKILARRPSFLPDAANADDDSSVESWQK
jgi:hypothetical protein